MVLPHEVAEGSGAHIEILCPYQLSPTHSGISVRTVNRMFARAERESPYNVILDDVVTISPRRYDAVTDHLHRKNTAANLERLDGVQDETVVCGRSNSSRRDAIGFAILWAGLLVLKIEL